MEKIAKKNIKALVVMTTDDNGKLIPAENSVQFHMYLSGPPYYEKKYNALYIKDKVKLLYDAYEPEKKLQIDSAKHGKLAEYLSNATSYTLFGKNAGNERPINKNGITLYNCTIPKGATYEELEYGEVVCCKYILGEKYVYPKRFMHLKEGDEVWVGIYSDTDRSNRHFKFLGKTYVTSVNDKNAKTSNSIYITVANGDRTFYLNPYSRDFIDVSCHIGGAIAFSLTKKGLIKSFTDKFGEWIKRKTEVIKNELNEINMIKDFLEQVNNC